MAWRLAKSLEVLRVEANQAAPGRSKASDGTIGDPAHTRRTSDHNPDAHGVVTALDLTHDPVNGADMHVWSEQLRLGRHPALKYIIWNRRITSRAIDGLRQWRTYNGTNPHTSHMHVSVGQPNVYDDTSPWGLGDEMPLSDEDLKQIYSRCHAATVNVFRQATGPDDASVPAGRWFGEVLGILRDLEDGSTVEVDYEQLAVAIVNEFMRRGSSG